MASSASPPQDRRALILRSQNDALTAQSRMQNLDERLSTFNNWPYSGRLRPAHMAAAGFYQHSPVSDAVSCFCCEVRMEGWNEQSDPIAEHQRASPSCSWNNGTYMTTLEERLGSFNTWPIDIKPLPITMAAAGFYHHNKASDGVACFSCELKLRDWKKDDDPIALHLDHSALRRQCAWLRKVLSQPETYVPPPPAVLPPAAETQRVPRKCGACHLTFPSGNQFHRHRRQAHRLIPGRLGVSLKRPAAFKRSGITLLGRHKVSKATHTKRKMRRIVAPTISSSDES